jgi:hypothetical protein
VKISPTNPNNKPKQSPKRTSLFAFKPTKHNEFQEKETRTQNSANFFKPKNPTK